MTDTTPMVRAYLARLIGLPSSFGLRAECDRRVLVLASAYAVIKAAMATGDALDIPHETHPSHVPVKIAHDLVRLSSPGVACEEIERLCYALGKRGIEISQAEMTR